MRMESIKIREATAADAAIIAQSVAMAIGEESIVKYCGSEYLKALEEAAAVPDTQYSYMNALIAEVDGVSAGAVVGYDGAKLAPLRERTLSIVRKYNKDLTVIDEETQAGEFYIDSLAVLPQFRGNGLGEHLLKAIVQMAFAMGHECVGLMVDNTDNPGVASFYARYGFQQVGEKRFFGHQMQHLQCTQASAIQKIQYTGLNYPQMQQFCGDQILAPYICMGFSMLSLLTPDGFVTVNEGDTICKDLSGKMWVE